MTFIETTLKLITKLIFSVQKFPFVPQVNMLKTYLVSSSTRQTCSICGRTLCRIGLTDLPSRSLSWTQRLRRVSALLGILYMLRILMSHSVLRGIAEVTQLQCEINTPVFVRTKNQQKINNAKFHAPHISLLPAAKPVLSALFSIKRSIPEFALHTLEGRCNQSLSPSLYPVQCLFRTST